MDELTIELANLTKNECQIIINKVSKLKDLDLQELNNILMPSQIYFNEKVNDLICNKKKKPNRRNLPKNEQCLGRKSDFRQCTRKRRNITIDGVLYTDFCGSHAKNLPKGKIGDGGACLLVPKGKRGRKRKDHKQNTGDDDILTIRTYIEGQQYLVDDNNIVYAYKGDDRPIILGLLENDKIVDIPVFN